MEHERELILPLHVLRTDRRRCLFPNAPVRWESQGRCAGFMKGWWFDEFQGDGILAFFGAPLAAADDPGRAVACAIEMQRAIARMNEEQRRLGLPELQIGVGVNTGEVIVGNIGSETRTKYGAVGSAINLAYRIESQTVGGQVLVGPNTFERVRAMVKVRRTVEAHLKGFDAPLTLYDVVGMDGPYAVALPDAATVTLVRLSTPLPVTCFPIDGKRVSGSGVSGRITELSESGAVACLGEPVERGDNVRIVLDGSHLAEVVDEPAVEELELYAKVVSVHPGHAGPGGIATSLVFTSLSSSARRALDQARDFAAHPA